MHWLPVEARIQFKVILLVWKSLHGCASDYITSLVNVRRPARNLRSSSRSLLELPSGPRTVFYGERSFAHAAPKCWNSLPENIKSVKRLDSFKRNLKTFFFRKICFDLAFFGKLWKEHKIVWR